MGSYKTAHIALWRISAPNTAHCLSSRSSESVPFIVFYRAAEWNSKKEKHPGRSAGAESS